MGDLENDSAKWILKVLIESQSEGQNSIFKGIALRHCGSASQFKDIFSVFQSFFLTVSLQGVIIKSSVTASLLCYWRGGRRLPEQEDVFL